MSEGLYPEPDGTLTGGWAGSDASHDRALAEALDGTLSKRQAVIVTMLGNVGPSGMTWLEVAARTGWHHGQASGALSTLHKIGRIARLQDRRDRCHIYVLPEHVGDRETRPAGRTRDNRDAYDRGLADGLKTAADAYAEGYLDAENAMQSQVDAARREAADYIAAVASGMLGAMENRVQSHYAGCWRAHPACALSAVLRAAEVVARR